MSIKVHGVSSVPDGYFPLQTTPCLMYEGESVNRLQMDIKRKKTPGL
jgi:hypothetical protein